MQSPKIIPFWRRIDNQELTSIFPFDFLPTTGVGLFVDFVPSPRIYKPFFQCGPGFSPGNWFRGATGTVALPKPNRMVPAQNPLRAVKGSVLGIK
jgi:hypothetical protein